MQLFLTVQNVDWKLLCFISIIMVDLLCFYEVFIIILVVINFDGIFAYFFRLGIVEMLFISSLCLFPYIYSFQDLICLFFVWWDNFYNLLVRALI